MIDFKILNNKNIQTLRETIICIITFPIHPLRAWGIGNMLYFGNGVNKVENCNFHKFAS